MAKWSARALPVCAFAWLMSGCVSTSTRSPVAPTHDHWLPGYLFGLLGKAELDVRDDCPERGAASVRVGATWATLAVSVITVGIYTPRGVSVQCRRQP